MDTTLILLKPGLPPAERERVFSDLLKAGYGFETIDAIFDRQEIYKVWPAIPDQYLPEMLEYYSGSATTIVKVHGPGCISFCLRLREEIRHRYQVKHPRTLIHASDNETKAQREVLAFFPP